MIGGKDCKAVTRTPKHEETFKIGSGITVKALHTPCHTQDSICWYMEDGKEKVVFTGDTLFIGGQTYCIGVFLEMLMFLQGCGRFFEGTPAEMHTALNEILAALPNDTKVYVSILPLPSKGKKIDRQSRVMNTRSRMSSF